MVPPLELVLAAVGYGILVPAAFTAGLLILARFWTRPLGHAAEHVGEALAVGAGLIAGMAALAWSGQIGWGFQKPVDSWHWLPLLALLALGAGVLERLSSVPTVVRWCLRLAVAAVTAWLLVRAESAYQQVHPGWYAGLALAVLAIWGLLDPLARDWPGAGLPLLLALVAVAAAVVLELSGIMQFAQVAGVLAAVLGGCACVAWMYPTQSPARGAMPAVAVLVPGLLFAGWFNTFSGVPLTSFLLVLAAPLALGATAFTPLSRIQGRSLWLLRIGVTLLVLGVAVTLAALA